MVYGGLSEFSEQLEMVPGRGGFITATILDQIGLAAPGGGFFTATGRPVFVHFLY